ncbi:MAG TPA: exodeoxyribonuclease VII large subunit, partial [Firmicutes bacterium]|nr:exodeoxyribonuclease VII large subunit [Bacillota bacterium]
MTPIWPLPALVYSVTELTRMVKENLESDPRLGSVWVRGEIGTFKRHSSGHVYFTLKDSNSLLRCVMFRSFARRLRFEPGSGLGVLTLGEVSVYERDGAYQLYVRELQPDGLGAQYLALEQTKERLTKEGLFALERKRPLPEFPRRVAVITSPVGAALQDILAVAKRRFAGIEILLCPVLVQGEEAPVQIVRTLERLNEIEDVDVVILARGGGSREDLWAFNNEQVARQIAASRAPVVSAIGHEIDNTLADLAADVRAPTPSAAAELVLPDKKQLARELLYCSQRLNEAMRQHLSRYRNALSAMLNQDPWYEPLSQLSERRQALLYAKGRVEQVEARFLTKKRAQLAEL